MEQEIQLNAHNKQEYPPMHTCEHIINRTMVNLFRMRAGLYLPISNGRKANSILRFHKHLRKTILHALKRLSTK